MSFYVGRIYGVFSFCGYQKENRRRFQKKIYCPSVHSEWCRQDCSIFFTYIGIGFTSGTNTSIITACASFFTVLFVPLFFKNDRLTLMKIIGCILGFGGIIAINFGGTVSTDTWFGDMMILFSTISAAAGNIIDEKSHNRTRSVPCNRFSAFNRRFCIACVGHMLRWQYWFDKC